MQRLAQTSITELREKLQQGIVQFAFRTKAGGIRFAMGTLNMANIPQDYHPKGNGGSQKVLAYYDLDVQG